MASLSYFAERMRYWCDEGNLGYDQTQRWNIWEGGECDCSSLVIHALDEAGFDTCSATYTGDLSWNLTQRGWVRLSPDISSARVGDILLSDANHVAAVVYGWGWWATIAEAWLDENGGIYYGQSGDQTGWETHTRQIYDFPWDCVLRYTGESEDDMNKDELISTRDSGNIPAWEAWSWAYTYAKDAAEAAGGKGLLDKEISTQASGNIPVWQAISWSYTYTKQLAGKLDAMQKTIDKLQTGGSSTVAIDYDKLANAVADKIAKRMVS